MATKDGWSAAVSSTDSAGGTADQDYHYEFTVQKGFFMQSENETDDKEFDFVCFLLFSLFLFTCLRFHLG